VVHEVENECGAEAPSAVLGQYRDPADLAAGLEPPGADRVTVPIDDDDVAGERVGVVPLFGLRDALFLDEDAPPDPRGPCAVAVPPKCRDPVSVGQLDRPHGAAQMPRARRAAAPV
jgi:hypothetical protein